MDEPSDLPSDLAGLEEDMSAIDVVLGELKGVTKRIVDMGLRCKMHDGVDRLGDEEVVDEVGAPDVALDELEVGRGARGVEVLQVGTVIELVEDDDLVLGVVPDEAVGDMRRDEACRPGNEDVLRIVRRHLLCTETDHPLPTQVRSKI